MAVVDRPLLNTDLDSVFDLDATVKQVDAVFERLRSLTPKEEPVHV